MPQMDGLEAARAIRSMDREDAKRIPIIALTANSFDEDVQLSIQAGTNAFIISPQKEVILSQRLLPLLILIHSPVGEIVYLGKAQA